MYQLNLNLLTGKFAIEQFKILNQSAGVQLKL